MLLSRRSQLWIGLPISNSELPARFAADLEADAFATVAMLRDVMRLLAVTGFTAKVLSQPPAWKAWFTYCCLSDSQNDLRWVQAATPTCRSAQTPWWCMPGQRLFFSTCLCCCLRTRPLWPQASVFVRAGLCFCELPWYVQRSDSSVLWWHCCEAGKDWKEGDPCSVVRWQKKNAARSCESTLRLGIQQMMWRIHQDQSIRWQSDVKNTKESTGQTTWEIFVKPTKDTLPDVGAAGNL